MSRQAQVGAFAILALLLLFGAFYVITDFGTRHTGYRVGVHFQSAAGLHSGALVYFSGVTVGTVDSITLLEDNTVDVILAINRDVSIPSASKFLIQAPLTGDPNMIIVPPPPPTRTGVQTVAVPMLEKRVLPIADQPVGTNSATIADLLAQGQTEVMRLDTMMSDLEKREPHLLDTLQSALNNANQLTVAMKSSITSLSAQLQSSLTTASSNIVSLTGSLNDTMQMNSRRINDIIVQFDQTSHALNASMASLQGLATDPTRSNRTSSATTKNIADTTKNMADITHDLRNVTSDPQTQAQLKNTVANLDATLQRANSLLGSPRRHVERLWRRSRTRRRRRSRALRRFPPGPPAVRRCFRTTRRSRPRAHEPTAGALHLRSRLSSIASNLISDSTAPERTLTAEGLLSESALQRRSRSANGFQRLDPAAWTDQVALGANDIGYHTTANVDLIKQLNASTTLGGGVLYSQLGLLGAYKAGIFGVNANVYNARRPDIDLYGNLHVDPRPRSVSSASERSIMPSGGSPTVCKRTFHNAQ